MKREGERDLLLFVMEEMVNMVGNKPLRHYLSGSLNKQLTSQQDQHVQLTSPVQFIKHYQPKHTVTNQAMYHVS